MIRDINNLNNVKMNVWLKPSPRPNDNAPRSFMGVDIPSRPFGEDFKVVSFWQPNDNETLLLFPMDQVASVEMYEDKSEDKK